MQLAFGRSQAAQSKPAKMSMRGSETSPPRRQARLDSDRAAHGTARFGQCSSLWARCHTGLDFAAGTGQPIRAVLGGRVLASGSCGCAYGRLTKIAVNGDLQMWYAHQPAQRVGVGDQVRTGQVIGAVGSTGNTTGPHPHLEVRVKGSPVDPEV